MQSHPTSSPPVPSEIAGQLLLASGPVAPPYSATKEPNKDASVSQSIAANIDSSAVFHSDDPPPNQCPPPYHPPSPSQIQPLFVWPSGQTEISAALSTTQPGYPIEPAPPAYSPTPSAAEQPLLTYASALPRRPPQILGDARVAGLLVPCGPHPAGIQVDPSGHSSATMNGLNVYDRPQPSPVVARHKVSPHPCLPIGKLSNIHYKCSLSNCPHHCEFSISFT